MMLSVEAADFSSRKIECQAPSLSRRFLSAGGFRSAWAIAVVALPNASMPDPKSARAGSIEFHSTLYQSPTIMRDR